MIGNRKAFSTHQIADSHDNHFPQNPSTKWVLRNINVNALEERTQPKEYKYKKYG